MKVVWFVYEVLALVVMLIAGLPALVFVLMFYQPELSMFALRELRHEFHKAMAEIRDDFERAGREETE